MPSLTWLPRTSSTVIRIDSSIITLSPSLRVRMSMHFLLGGSSHSPADHRVAGPGSVPLIGRVSTGSRWQRLDSEPDELVFDGRALNLDLSVSGMRLGRPEAMPLAGARVRSGSGRGRIRSGRLPQISPFRAG